MPRWGLAPNTLCHPSWAPLLSIGMDARETPGRSGLLSSTSFSNLQLLASSPVAQFHHDGSGSVVVFDSYGDSPHLIHPGHQFQLGPNTVHGPFEDQNPPPHAYSRAPSVAATVDVAGSPFVPTDIFRAPHTLELTQTGPGARYEATFQELGAVFPPTAATTPSTSFPVRRALVIGLGAYLSGAVVDGIQRQWGDHRRSRP